MIDIIDKRNCCGCEACINACPKGCISPIIDEEGFLYPKVDLSKCIDCHICEQVCPELTPYNSINNFKSYAAWNTNNSIRMSSSSGGIFSAIAEEIIRDGGIVYGARFNETLELSHRFCDNIDELSKLRGSKYLQSRIGDTFKHVRDNLIKNRVVLFSGTGCQIAGLKHYLKKDYPNLYTIEVICHGVPSPKVWKDYVRHIIGNKIQGKNPIISFRNKRQGWKRFSMNIEWQSKNKAKRYICEFQQDVYMKCFLKNLTLRPSCYNCPVKESKSGADLLLGDFWGIENCYPQYDDDKGCSAVIVLSEKGSILLNLSNLEKRVVDYENILIGNPILRTSVSEPAQRARFWCEYNRSNSIRGRYIVLSSFALGYKRTIWHEYKDKTVEIMEKIRYKMHHIKRLNK